MSALEHWGFGLPRSSCLPAWITEPSSRLHREEHPQFRCSNLWLTHLYLDQGSLPLLTFTTAISHSKAPLLLVSVSASSVASWLRYWEICPPPQSSHYTVSGLLKQSLKPVPTWVLSRLRWWDMGQVTVCYAWNKCHRTCCKLVMEWTGHSSAKTQQLVTKEKPVLGTMYRVCCQDQKLEKKRIIYNVCCILPHC